MINESEKQELITQMDLNIFHGDVSLAIIFHKMSYLLGKTFGEVYQRLGIDYDVLVKVMHKKDPSDEEIKQVAEQAEKIKNWFDFSRPEIKEILLASYLPVFAEVSLEDPDETELVQVDLYDLEKRVDENVSGSAAEGLVVRIMKHIH